MALSARELLLFTANHFNNDWEAIYAAVKTRDFIVEDYVPNPLGLKECVYLDEDYPPNVKNFVPKPPFVFYYKGDFSALKRTDYTYLVGENTFDIPTKDLITIDATKNMADFGGILQVYISKSQYDIMKFAMVFANKLVVTKIFDGVPAEVVTALTINVDVYVTPTTKPSANNTLIKEGANLIDSKEDLL